MASSKVLVINRKERTGPLVMEETPLFVLVVILQDFL